MQIMYFFEFLSCKIKEVLPFLGYVIPIMPHNMTIWHQCTLARSCNFLLCIMFPDNSVIHEKTAPSVWRGARLSRFTCTVWLLVNKKKSTEMVLSKDGFHFYYQCIDISYIFNFGYYWLNINEVRKKQNNNCG